MSVKFYLSITMLKRLFSLSIQNVNFCYDAISDVRKQIIRSGKKFIGMSLRFVSHHCYKNTCFACKRVGQKQGSEDYPAKGPDKVCMCCADLLTSSECRGNTFTLCASCESFHSSSSCQCCQVEKL